VRGQPLLLSAASDLQSSFEPTDSFAANARSSGGSSMEITLSTANLVCRPITY